MLEYRARLGLGQTTAAEAANVTADTWSRVETGRTAHAHLRTRARIEGVLPPLQDEPPNVVHTIEEHQRGGRSRMPPQQTHRHDLSTGLIKCQVITDQPLPATAYAVLAELVAALEAANTKLLGLVDDAVS